MIDPSDALHKALVARLNTTGFRVYDAPPEGAVLPYITLGQPQVLPDRNGCEPGARVAYPIDGWAVGPQSVEIKRLGAAIIAALHEHELVLEGHRTVLCELEQLNYLNDPDGITKHAAAVFQIVTEPVEA